MSPLRLSYEVFPPADDTGRERLADTVRALNGRGFEFVSVTYGAGGGQRDRSFAAIETVAKHADCPIAAHLTCVGVSRDDATEVIDRYLDLGVTHIVALRGDPPEGIDQPYVAHPDGFASTAELVAAICERAATRSTPVDVTVSAYPEVHPQSPNLGHDLDVLAAKIDAGATCAITQMFFEPMLFDRYIAAARARDIDIDVIAGIMALHPLERITGFAARCGAQVPTSLTDRINAAVDSRAEAVACATEQMAALQELGYSRFHLYTLNRAGLVSDIVTSLENR